VGWWWAFATDRHRELAAEHRQLMDLTLARDASAAVEALAEHIKRAPDQLFAYAYEHGLDDFDGPPCRVIRTSHVAGQTGGTAAA
jgi:DNA-binding GntR family transcriptional regulator